MLTVRVNDERKYWLKGLDLPVYGYQDYKFLLWDPICDEWIWVSVNPYCSVNKI